MTAAEAAERAHEEWSQSRGDGTSQRSGQPQKGGPDDAPCSSDTDCTLTRIATGSCCASLCSPRAVTQARAAVLERNSASCKPCPEPLCRDPGRFEATCVSGRCTARKVASPD